MAAPGRIGVQTAPNVFPAGGQKLATAGNTLASYIMHYTTGMCSQPEWKCKPITVQNGSDLEGKMAKETRADEMELEARLGIISDMIVAGKSQAAIVQQCLKEYSAWDVTDRQIRNYYKAAWERYAEGALGIDRKAESYLAALRLDHVYSKAIDSGKLNTARLAVVDKIKLFKLDAPAAEYDWRKALEELGISPGESFEQLVQHLTGNSDHDETTD